MNRLTNTVKTVENESLFNVAGISGSVKQRTMNRKDYKIYSRWMRTLYRLFKQYGALDNVAAAGGEG